MTADQANLSDATSSAYVDAFLTERPRDGMDQVQTRLRKALKLNEELAEYFKERAHAEDLYAKTLAKISKKHFVSDPVALGNMRPIWEMLQNELSEVYTIHAIMSMKISEDVEGPLRSSIQNNSEYNNIKLMDADLQRVAKDYDDRTARLNKHKSKGKKSSDLLEMTRAVEEVKAHWVQNGPDYIQKHQAVDESRWHGLKTAVQTFEVLQNDQMLKRVEVANNVLTAASNFDVADEITAFCTANKKSTTVQQSIPRSEQSMLSIDSTPSETLSVPQHHDMGLTGPTPVPSISEQSHRSTGGQSTGGKSTGGKSTGGKSTSGKSTGGKKPGKERKFFSGLMSIRRKTRAADNNGYMNADLSPPVLQHHDQHSSTSFGGIDTGSSISTGFASERDDTHHSASRDDSMSPAPTSPISGSASIKKAPSFSGSLASNQPPKVLVDAEGYTIPPADRAAWPGDSSLIDDDFGSDSGSMLSSQQRLKVDIKTEAQTEDAAQSAVALTRVSSMLKEKSTSAPSARRRGRRENRSTRLLDPVQEAKVVMPVTLTDGPVVLTDSPLGTPSAQLQRSPFDEMSPAPAAATAATAPPQIKVQITETIHALLKGGELERGMVTGEVKLVYTGPAEAAQPVYLRIQGLDGMDQVAPNTSYLTGIDGAPGVFRLDTGMFHLAGDSAVACIKYQQPVGEQALPLWARPMWKCEAEQTRLLVKYRKNGISSSSSGGGAEAVAAHDVQGVFFMTTVGGDVQNVQSIPAGQWMVEQERMVWPMGDWQDADEHMLRAKFITKQEGAPQPVAIRFQGNDWLVSDAAVHMGEQPQPPPEGGVWAHVQSVDRAVRTGKYIAEA